MVCGLGLLAICTLGDGVRALFSFRSTSIALVDGSWVGFGTQLAGRGFPTSLVSVTKALALSTLGRGWGRVDLLCSDADAQEVQRFSDCLLRLLLGSKGNNANVMVTTHDMPLEVGGRLGPSRGL